MKRVLVLLLTVVCTFSFAACGGSDKTQTIEFQGITMNIPAKWKAEESTLSDTYAVYEKTGKSGLEYQLLLMDTFGLMEDDLYDLEGAGAFFKEVTEDDASYSDPSDPVAGTFAGKYDMHTIDCTFNVLNVLEGEKSYPCKLIRIYMGDHDVEIRCCSESGDFEAFETAITEAVCD